MKNVRFEFTDTDYELVTKAYEQYEKLHISQGQTSHDSKLLHPHFQIRPLSQ